MRLVGTQALRDVSYAGGGKGDTERVANLTREFRTVQRVEVQRFDALVHQIRAQLGAECLCQKIMPVL